MNDRPAISAEARLLGFAGLLPQLAALLLIATRIDPALGALMAFGYAAVIFSFIGGIWWGFAMRSGAAQPRMAAVAVAPTLATFLLLVGRLSGLRADIALVTIGVLLLLSVLVDRRLVTSGVAPPGWMGLRLPLSLGLGGMTILAGALAPASIAIVYSS